MGRSGFFRLVFSTCCILGFWAGPLPARAADAASFPDKPIHWLVSEAPGGTSDLIARLISPKLTERLGQPVVVMSRPGAGGTIAAGYVAHAAPDGYNIVENTAEFTAPPIGFKPDFDPLTSFAPITEIGFTPSFLVANLQLPVNTLQELIAYGRANPGKLNFADTGDGSTTYWASLYFKKLTGIAMVNISFSAGSGPIQTALLGNEIQLSLFPVSTSLPLVTAGKVKALAVTGTARAPLLPSVPTFVEAAGMHGFDDIGQFYGLLAPAGTPKEIVRKLRDGIVAVIQSDDFLEAMSKRGLVIVGNTPEEYTALIRQSATKWTTLQAEIVAAKPIGN